MPNKVNNRVAVERLGRYSQEDAVSIGRLLPILSTTFSSNPVSKNLLKEIISSPYHEQIVARFDGVIVGFATLSITIGAGAGHKAYLEDFVVDPDIQGQGIGTIIWQEISKWCLEKDVPLHFTSNSKRESAQRFYTKHGATVYDTVVFNYSPPVK